jgi:threonine dehydrogenase-like Zn-dependent dehydrogenase
LNDQPFPGEALGCAMNVFRRCDIQPHHHVAIVGLGFLGAVLTQLASRTGARTYAISRRSFALSIARQMGATATIPLDDHRQVVEEVNRLAGRDGCDRVIEATGLQGPLDLASELTAERGRLIIAGYHQDGPRQVNMQLWNWRGIDVINAHERDPRVYVEGMADAASAVANGELDPRPLYTHRFALEQLPDALNQMRERTDGFLKALVTYA